MTAFRLFAALIVLVAAGALRAQPAAPTPTPSPTPEPEELTAESFAREAASAPTGVGAAMIGPEGGFLGSNDGSIEAEWSPDAGRPTELARLRTRLREDGSVDAEIDGPSGPVVIRYFPIKVTRLPPAPKSGPPGEEPPAPAPPPEPVITIEEGNGEWREVSSKPGKSGYKEITVGEQDRRTEVKLVAEPLFRLRLSRRSVALDSKIDAVLEARRADDLAGADDEKDLSENVRLLREARRIHAEQGKDPSARERLGRAVDGAEKRANDLAGADDEKDLSENVRLVREARRLHAEQGKDTSARERLGRALDRAEKEAAARVKSRASARIIRWTVNRDPGGNATVGTISGQTGNVAKAASDFQRLNPSTSQRQSDFALATYHAPKKMPAQREQRIGVVVEEGGRTAFYDETVALLGADEVDVDFRLTILVRATRAGEDRAEDTACEAKIDGSFIGKMYPRTDRGKKYVSVAFAGNQNSLRGHWVADRMTRYGRTEKGELVEGGFTKVETARGPPAGTAIVPNGLELELDVAAESWKAKLPLNGWFEDVLSRARYKTENIGIKSQKGVLESVPTYDRWNMPEAQSAMARIPTRSTSARILPDEWFGRISSKAEEPNGVSISYTIEWTVYLPKR